MKYLIPMLLLAGCTETPFAYEAPPKEDPWCQSFRLALNACDVDHYGDPSQMPAVVLGCTDVALAAFDTPLDGRLALASALLGAYGYGDDSGFNRALLTCGD